MTLPDDLVKAAKEAKCLRYDNDGRQCLFADPRFTGAEWRSGHYVHPECAVAAVLRVLGECEAIEEAVRATVYDGNMAQAHRIARRVLAAIAKLVDDTDAAREEVPTNAPRVTDLLAELEASITAAKAARLAKLADDE